MWDTAVGVTRVWDTTAWDIAVRVIRGGYGMLL